MTGLGSGGKKALVEHFINGMAVYAQGDPAAPAVVLVHGFPYSAGMWRNQVAELGRGYHCVTYDVRGMGKSPAGDGQFTVESLVDDLVAVMDALELQRPVLAGLSMGGYIALRAAEREAERFRGLILCDTKAEADGDAAKIRRAELIELINRDGMERFASLVVPATFAEGAASRIPDVYGAALREAKGQDPLGAKGCLLAMAARTDTTGSLARLGVPVLLVVGEEDALTPPDVMMAMRDEIPDAHLVVIPGAGHMSPLESPGAVTRAMGEFLARVSRV